MLRCTEINVRMTVYTSNTAYFLRRFSPGQVRSKHYMIVWALEAVLVAGVHCIKIRLNKVLSERKGQYFATHVRSRKGFEVVSDVDSESARAQRP